MHGISAPTTYPASAGATGATCAGDGQPRLYPGHHGEGGLVYRSLRMGHGRGWRHGDDRCHDPFITARCFASDLRVDGSRGACARSQRVGDATEGTASAHAAVVGPGSEISSQLLTTDPGRGAIDGSALPS